MRRIPSYFVVFRLLILLKTATVIVSLDQADFSAKLGQVVENVLGAKQFEVISPAIILIIYSILIAVFAAYFAARSVKITNLHFFGKREHSDCEFVTLWVVN